jgi:GNAT superfamily N-acetyltransferase
VAGLAVIELKAFRGRDADIYRPYRDEIPWELLALAEPDEARLMHYADADYLRVAKNGNDVAGAYVVEALAPTRFCLRLLVVEPGYRGKGLGAWLLGHAIGLSESKGGREIVVPDTRPRSLFTRVGFVPQDDHLLLTLTPE